MPKGQYVRHSGNSGRAVRKKYKVKVPPPALRRSARETKSRANAALKQQIAIFQQPLVEKVTKPLHLTRKMITALIKEANRYNTNGLNSKAIEAAAILCTLSHDRSLQ